MKGKTSRATLAPKMPTLLNMQMMAPSKDPQKIVAPMKSKLHLASSQNHVGSIGTRSLVPETGSDSQLASHLLSLPGRDIVLILTVDGRIVEANEAAISGYPYDRNTLLSKHVADLRTPSEKSWVGQQLADAQQRGVRFETVHRRADGSQFRVEVVSNAIIIGGEKFLLSVGLGGMRERIAQLKGDFSITSTGQGTEIVATLPSPSQFEPPQN